LIVPAIEYEGFVIQGRTPDRTDGKKDKHYVIVREDLPLNVAAAMVVHASGESASLRSPPKGCHSALLAASKKELEELDTILRWEKIPFRSIYEDAPPYSGELVAIGIAPCEENLGRWLRKFPSLGKERRPGSANPP